ncbi:MAG: hypothetical protein HQK96_12935 [Nitrospirae bacterium]|nr:hypothetical protein [Nitrospirota bacterium]
MRSQCLVNGTAAFEGLELKVEIGHLTHSIIDLFRPVCLEGYTLYGRRDGQYIETIGGITVEPYILEQRKNGPAYQCYYKEKDWSQVLYVNNISMNETYVAWNHHYIWIRSCPKRTTISLHELNVIVRTALEIFCTQYNFYKNSKDAAVPCVQINSESLYASAYVKKAVISLDYVNRYDDPRQYVVTIKTRDLLKMGVKHPHDLVHLLTRVLNYQYKRDDNQW